MHFCKNNIINKFGEVIIIEGWKQESFVWNSTNKLQYPGVIKHFMQLGLCFGKETKNTFHSFIFIFKNIHLSVFAELMHFVYPTLCIQTYKQ